MQPSVARLNEKPSLVEILKTKPSLDEEEAATYANVSISYLRKGREGTLPPGGASPPVHIKLGRSVRYLREDLDLWLKRFPKLRNRAVGGES